MGLERHDGAAVPARGVGVEVKSSGARRGHPPGLALAFGSPARPPSAGRP